MQKLKKSFLVMTLATSTMSFLTSCTDQEILGSALIVGGAIVASDSDYPSRPVYSRPTNRYCDYFCREQRSRWDRERRDRVIRRERDSRYGRRDGRSEGRHADRRNFTTISEVTALNVFSQADSPSFVSTDARVIRVADKYQITQYAATYIVRAVALAQAKDVSGIKDLGIDAQDFKKVLQGVPLETAKTQAMSQKLIMSEKATEKLLFEIGNDTEFQMKNKN